jgi:hypothetical protein
LALVPILGNKTEALVTENSSRTVNVRRGGRQVYVDKNGYEVQKTRTEYTYSYEFLVNGEKYTGSSSEYEQTHKKGGKVTVYYLPFYPKIHSSMKPIYLYFLCGICFLSGLVLMRSVFTGRRPEINIGGRNNGFAFGPKYPSNNAVQSVLQNQNPQPMQQFVPVQSQTIPQPQQFQQIPSNSNTNGYSFCPKCGSPLGAGYAFCPKCGCKC